MSDCQHWIPIMLEQERAELHKEKMNRELDAERTKKMINEVRAILNAAESSLSRTPLPPMGHQNLFTYDQLDRALRMQQASYGPQYGQNPCQSSSLFGGLLGGLFGF